MMICVPTVMHTGTYFVTEGLLKEFIKHPIKTGYVGDGVYSDHVYPHKRKWWKPLLESTDYIIVPLRHPLIVWEAWRRRGRAFKNFSAQWQELIEFVDQYQPLYLPLDVENRQLYLDKLQAKLGVNIITDWKPINIRANTYDIDWHDLYMNKQVKHLINEHTDFFNRFYKVITC